MSQVVSNDYLCPIGLGVMTDPVIDANGHTFDRVNIERWYQRSQVSPITHQLVAHTRLTPNLLLKRQILEYQESNTITKAEPPPPPSKSYTPNLPILTYQDNVVKVDASHLTSRSVQHFLFLVDTSGSMGTGVPGRDDQDREVDYGLSLMDIVKHACLTLFKVLLEVGHDSYITIISFNSHAEREIVFHQVTSEGEASFIRTIEGLRPGGTTNIWDAIRLAFQTVKELNTSHSSLVHKPILFTDGVPNIHPFMSESDLGRQYQDQIRRSKQRYGIDCHLNTIGFGKGSGLDMELLSKIAGDNQGISCYVSDLSMYNTVWLYVISNLLNETDWVSPSITYHLDGHTHCQPINKLLCGQSKLIPLPLGCSEVCFHAHQQTPISITESSKVSETERVEARFRGELVELLDKLVHYGLCGDLITAKNEIDSLVYRIEQSNQESSVVSAYLQDLQCSGKLHGGGQVALAVSRQDWFQDWGIHYLTALKNGHEMMCKTNFKDQSLVYDTESVKDTLQMAELVFGEMDPPKASNRTARSQVMRSTSSMYRASGGCWSGETLITLANGKLTPISEIEAGMWVKTTKGDNRVKCRVDIHQPHSGVMMTHLGKGNLISPYHPIRYDNQWCFPKVVLPTQIYYLHKLYNLVLEDPNDRLLEVGGFVTPTFGHGLRGTVIGHEYFGTQKIIDDLEKQSGFSRGCVELVSNAFIRDIESGLVMGLYG